MNSHVPPTDYSPPPRFRIGDLVDIGQPGILRVCRVTDCCTVLEKETERTASFTPRFAEKPVTFTPKPKKEYFRISNQAECRIVERKA